jgi:signal peptidase I
MQTVVVALFVLTFIVQPLLIPSESMEHTLLVGDFLLFNKQTYAPADRLSRWLLPYLSPARGDIVVFRHPDPPMLIKRSRRPATHRRWPGVHQRRRPQ